MLGKNSIRWCYWQKISRCYNDTNKTN